MGEWQCQNMSQLGGQIAYFNFNDEEEEEEEGIAKKSKKSTNVVYENP